MLQVRVHVALGLGGFAVLVGLHFASSVMSGRASEGTGTGCQSFCDENFSGGVPGADMQQKVRF